MKTILSLFLVSGVLFASAKPVPSGEVKVLKGPEGAKISMLEVNDGNEALVQFKGVKGDHNGQTRLLKITTMTNGEQEFTYLKKKGSKMIEILVMKGGKGYYQFLQPGVENWLSFNYDEKLSEKATKESILDAYKP